MWSNAIAPTLFFMELRSNKIQCDRTDSSPNQEENPRFSGLIPIETLFHSFLAFYICSILEVFSTMFSFTSKVHLKWGKKHSLLIVKHILITSSTKSLISNDVGIVLCSYVRMKNVLRLMISAKCKLQASDECIFALCLSPCDSWLSLNWCRPSNSWRQIRQEDNSWSF